LSAKQTQMKIFEFCAKRCTWKYTLNEVLWRCQQVCDILFSFFCSRSCTYEKDTFLSKLLCSNNAIAYLHCLSITWLTSLLI